MNNPLFNGVLISARQRMILDRGTNLNEINVPNGGCQPKFSPWIIPQWAVKEKIWIM